MTREETLDLLRAGGLKHIATVLEQTRPRSILVAREYERELGQLGALLVAHRRGRTADRE